MDTRHEGNFVQAKGTATTGTGHIASGTTVDGGMDQKAWMSPLLRGPTTYPLLSGTYDSTEGKPGSFQRSRAKLSFE